MALEHPIAITVQNLFISWTFSALFALTLLYTGSMRGLLIAFVLASLASFVHSYFLNRLLPVPRKTAVLITGCSSGIGEAAALRLLKTGFLVFATVRKQEDADALKAKTGKSDMLHTLLLDVTDHARIKSTVEAVRQRLALDGRQLLGVVLNAGGAEQSPLELLPLDVLRAQLELNVLGAVALTQAFLPLLRSASSPAHSSRVLFVSSISGRFVVPGLASYSSSKFALEAVANAFRMELRRWHVDAVLIEPGQIATRFGQRVESSSKGWEGTGSEAASALYAGVKDRFFHLLLGSDRVEWACDAIELGLRSQRPRARIMAGWTALPTLPYLAMPTEMTDPIMGYAFR